MDFTRFKEMMRQHFRLDLNSYKETQLKRRLDAYLVRQQLAGYGALFQKLKDDPWAYQSFLDYLTINVSEFFRDPERFRELESIILPALLKEKRTLKIWSAGCAAGAEPYSVAIILEELTPGHLHHLEATDIDQNILVKAKEGRYPPEVVRNVSPQRLARFFDREDGLYVINEKFRRRVAFRRHDLLNDPFGQGYDLILCRNVTIYFTREAQDRLNEKLARALAPGGVLFIGGSEMIFNYQELGLEKLRTCFYRKREAKGGGF
ncbi:CheR family methyltransferase [Desulfofundulus thermosubterraneus]|uniref:protein-glutamate O-methyltransferase n=1 Tax=Desulfofundulus thermosubterraneus DSM 16057 TaxID=1121432 RepID=A0A1M6FV83_9FIRM|nr:protein-glutamate O-methyltransferase CheR [Desulfofundulus thermosubterraneus]SHJ01539.1 chemotaxis protein methyltransferase CheR [Desulfofundulus thermosubterraneus DSM 16057]